MRELQIGSTTLTDASEAYLIAEIGNNHQGDADVAVRLIREAARAGASAVKFQRRTIDALYTKAYLDRPYVGLQSFGSTYGEHRRALELKDEDWPRLQEIAAREEVDFFATPFDIPAVKFLADLGVPCMKTAGAFIDNWPLMHACLKETSGPLLVSTGGATDQQIRDVVMSVPQERLCLMHSTAAYPCRDDEVDLPRIVRHRLDYPNVLIGYSNHHPGPLMPAVAYAMGAIVLEVHFTLERAMRGTDHAMSLEPNGLAKLKSYVTRIHRAKQTGAHPFPSELKPLEKMGHSLYAAERIPRGTPLTRENITFKSPRVMGGISPSNFPILVGLKAARDMEPDDAFLTEDYPALHATHG